MIRILSLNTPTDISSLTGVTAMGNAVFGTGPAASVTTPTITALLAEKDSADVKTFLNTSKHTAQQAIAQSELPKLLGVSAATIAAATAVAAAAPTAGVVGKVGAKSANVSAILWAWYCSSCSQEGSCKISKKFASPVGKAHAQNEYYSDQEEDSRLEAPVLTMPAAGKGGKRASVSGGVIFGSPQA